jgi:hypothetical protein
MFKNAFWERSSMRPHLSEARRQDVFEKEVLDPALLHSSLSVIQSTCEVAALYPADVELKRTVIDAWNVGNEHPRTHHLGDQARSALAARGASSDS